MDNTPVDDETGQNNEEEERVLEEDRDGRHLRRLSKVKLEEYKNAIRKLGSQDSEGEEEEEQNKQYLNYAHIFKQFTEYLDPITNKFDLIDNLQVDKDEDNEFEYDDQAEKIEKFFGIFEPNTDPATLSNKIHGPIYNSLVELFQTDIEDDFQEPSLDVVIMFQEQMQAYFQYESINKAYIESLRSFYNGHFIDSIKQLVNAFANPDKPESQGWLNICGAPSIMKYSANFHREISNTESFGNLFKGLTNSDTSKHKFIKEFIPLAEKKLDTFEGTELANRAINNYYDEVLSIIKEESFSSIVNEMINSLDYNFMITALMRICRQYAHLPNHKISFKFNDGSQKDSDTSYVSLEFTMIIFEEFQKFLQKVLDEKLQDLNAKVSREVYEDMAKYTADHILKIFNKELLHGFEISEPGLAFDFSFIKNPIEHYSNSLTLLASFLFSNFNNNLLNFVKVYIDHTLNQTGFVSLFNINMQNPKNPVTSVKNVIGLLNHIDVGLDSQQPLIYWEVVPTIEVI